MILNVYSIRDTKVSAFTPPFYSQTHGSALRAFSDHVNENGTQANKHPEDFELFHLGEFDDQLGTIKSTTPTRIGTASEYKETAK